MLRKLMMLVMGTVLVAVPVAAQAPLIQAQPDVMDKMIEICVTDMKMYAEGDKTWIERNVADMPRHVQQQMVNHCYIFGRGVQLGTMMR